jgi:hypothetical protein
MVRTTQEEPGGPHSGAAYRLEPLWTAPTRPGHVAFARNSIEMGQLRYWSRRTFDLAFVSLRLVSLGVGRLETRAAELLRQRLSCPGRNALTLQSADAETLQPAIEPVRAEIGRTRAGRAGCDEAHQAISEACL